MSNTPTPTPLASTAIAGSVKLAITCIRLSGRIQGDVPDDVLQHWGAVQDMSRLIDRHFQPLLAKVEEPTQAAEYGEARPMARRANWDKRRRMRLQIGALGDAKSVTVTWEGNSTEVDAIACKFMKAVNGERALRADLAAKEADTAILDWLEKNATICAKYRREPPAFAHTGPHYWAIDWGKYGNETTLTLREAARSALASRADKGGVT